MASTKTVLVPIGNGSEDMETAILVDVLRRGGADVTVASVEGELMCTMARKMKFEADCFIQDCAEKEYDLIALPGGMPGAERLRDSAPLITLLKAQKASNQRKIAAICAAPAVVLAHHDLLAGTAATAHPAFVSKITTLASKGDCSEGRVVLDGNIISSRGPGTAIEFALCLVEQLFGRETALQVEGAMVTAPPAHAPQPDMAPMEWALHPKPAPEPEEEGAAPS